MQCLVKIGSVGKRIESRLRIFPMLLLSPFDKGHGPSFEKIKFSLQKKALSQDWLKLVQWFWRRFLKVNNTFALCHYYPPRPIAKQLGLT